MSVSDIKALKKWNAIPDNIKELLLSNVFCSNCLETRVVDYSITTGSHGLVIEGKCVKCGKNVARVVED